MTAAEQPTREPAHFVIHPGGHPQTATGESPAAALKEGARPSAWRQGAGQACRVEAENGVRDPKGTSARLVARGLAGWGRCLISPETAQELKTTANDSSRLEEHQTAQCPGLLVLQG